MIVKNEEDVLARCLSCAAKFADEIIIVDTGSSDKTKEIAARFTPHIYDYEWTDDFSAARNYSFSKAGCDYIMWLDADDVIDDSNITEILSLKHTLTGTDVVFMKYNTGFDSAGNPVFTYYRERLIKRCPLAVWHEPVHEVIAPFGKIVYSDIAISHSKIKPPASGRNLNIMKKFLADGGIMSPRLQFYYGRELMYNNDTAAAVKIFENYLEGCAGWIENNICACRDLADCYKSLNADDKALKALLRSLEYDEPRPETSFMLGNYFFGQNNYNAAAFWYTSALNYKHGVNAGFYQPEYNGYLPAIQLTVVYDKLGDHETACKYNETAGKYKPDSAAYLHNKTYFGKLLSK